MISNFKKNWTLTLAVSAWILIPQASRAAEPTAAIPDPHDLSYEEIRSAVKDFGADVNAEKGTVTLRGFIYKACLDQIEIRTKESTGRVDYIIRDVGNLKGCLAEQKKRHPAERLGNEAVFARLSKLPAAVITAGDRDLEVGIGWENTEVDPPRVVSKSFPEPIRFVSSSSREYERRERERSDLNRQLDNCESVARTSRGTEEKELEALAALDILLRHEKIDEDDADKIRSDISQASLQRLRERTVKARPEEFADLDRELFAWEHHHAGGDQKKHDLVAQIRMDFAEKMSRAAPASVETNEAALVVMQEISESSSVSKTRKESAAGKIETMRGNVVAAHVISSSLAQASVMPLGAQAFQVQSMITSQPEYIEFVQGLQREAMDACNSANRSRGKDRTALLRCQQAQASLAREPQRVLQLAAQEVSRTLAATTHRPVPQVQQQQLHPQVQQQPRPQVQQQNRQPGPYRTGYQMPQQQIRQPGPYGYPHPMPQQQNRQPGPYGYPYPMPQQAPFQPGMVR